MLAYRANPRDFTLEPKSGPDDGHLKICTRHDLNLQERTAIHQLIHKVWTHEQSTSGDVEVLASPDQPKMDPLDLSAVHILVWHQERMVGYGRLSIYKGAVEIANAPLEVPCLKNKAQRIGYLSRLVIDPSFRGIGLSRIIDEERIEIAREHGVQILSACVVGLKRQQALRTLGFQMHEKVDHFETPWYRTTRPVSVMTLQVP
jgi:predicted GNAT family N-acyltransferase